ncbi:MAG: glycine cleavage system protein GcvH [Thermomicrobiales bacterium]|nr:glycine cleavage system protein GcvH [Thermomicrobiales bacterium]
MSSPKDLRYTKSHEWVRIDGDVATIGVTDHAQSELGDITYLELPDAGDQVSGGEAFGVVESVKAASDVYSPVDGEVIERNEDAIAAPDVVNSSPYDGAWLIKVRVSDPAQVEALLTPDQYDELVESSGGH